jgi:hypothetical protein
MAKATPSSHALIDASAELSLQPRTMSSQVWQSSTPSSNSRMAYIHVAMKADPVTAAAFRTASEA